MERTRKTVTGAMAPASRRFSDAARGARRLAALAAALAPILTAGPAVAEDGDAPCGAVCLAKGLIENIPAGERIALIPFGPPATAIPGAAADRLYDRIARALFEASNRRHVLVSRDRRDDIWRDWQTEREKSDYTAFWKSRKVGVTVGCTKVRLRGEELELSCVASPVGEDSRLRGDQWAPLAVFPVEAPFGYAYALTGLGLALAKRAPAPGRIAKLFVADAVTGQQSKLTLDMGSRIRRIVEERFETRRRNLEGQANLGLGGEAPVEPPVGYDLRGEIAWTNEDTARLTAALRDGGVAAAAAEIEIERGWLPRGLLGPGAGTRRYGASARAVPSDGFGAESAKRAAKNLARARVVAKALGLTAPDIEDARSEADGVRALRLTLERGVPADERFSGPWRGAGGWRVGLDARVVKPGADTRPDFGASLSKDALRAGEEIRIRLSAREAVHAALFAWGADGTVIRLYPHFKEPELTVPAGGRVSLPRDRACSIASAPLPGDRSNHEAIVVIAANERLPFESLAPPFCHDWRTARPPTPVSGATFLAALAKLDLRRAALAVLPYRVAR